MQLDEHLEPRPPLPAEATQLELLHAQMASLQARVRKMEEEAAAPSASGIFSLKENSVLSTAAEDASAKEGDLLEEADVSSVFNMYGWCLDTAFGDVQEGGGVNLLSASGKILLLAALAFIQLTFAFGVYDVSMLFKLRDDTNAFKPFVDNSLFYADAATLRTGACRSSTSTAPPSRSSSSPCSCGKRRKAPSSRCAPSSPSCFPRRPRSGTSRPPR